MGSCWRRDCSSAGEGRCIVWRERSGEGGGLQEKGLGMVLWYNF